MTKVAFYINNESISNVDCTSILDSNPGIGGTEYLFYYTAYKLQSYSESTLDTTLLTSSICKLPKDCKYQKVGNKAEAIKFCIKSNINVLVVKYEEKDFSPNIFSEIKNDIKIYIWAHNIIPDHILTIIAKTHTIKKVINVGKEQLDLYRDHLAFKKSTYIYNSINIKPKEFYLQNSIPFKQRQNEITYLGSLVPIKGFHLLAKAWPSILQAYPDAHLNVIGSGNVYGNAQLGKYGIAEESYEKQFMPYLTKPNGEILPSVTFYGKLGEEKNKILAKTKIGIPNPSGYSETFCLSAIEMELYGCKIVTKKYVGFLDTVPPSGGILYKHESSLATNIIKELQQNENNSYKETYDFISRNFNTTKIISEWTKVLIDDSYINDYKIVNPEYNFKLLREKNRKIKSFLPFGFLLPTIDNYITILKKIFPFLSIKNLY
ncbi:glycosyltransferase [Phocaeicola plebeius]|jgi:glycosyltransferase involved in cell wall biosynthesis|uniref:Glycosyltransferase family 1 protein n=1 Tax=Phocaeicola plebeius TaxID=310297 RepID=A0A3E4N2Y1_9BACT|nr:glycosyltransferase [Phocaeicola plebeius]RGK56343.1 glycosyltransferase family 1 protein [Phocaeicola plebeius]